VSIWLVSFMQYDIAYFDLEACRVERMENPFTATSARRSQTCRDLQLEEAMAPLRGRHRSAVDHVFRTGDGSSSR